MAASEQKRHIDYVDTKDMSQSSFAFTEKRIVWQRFSANREPHTAIANLNIQNVMCIIMDVREGNFNEKTLFSQGERLIRRCSYC